MEPSEIFLDDCMTGMSRYPDGYFDLAIVDPEYGIGLDMVYEHGTTETIHEKKEWNNLPPGPEYFKELYRVSKHRIIWGCNYFPGLVTDVGRIVHDKMLEIEDTKLKYSEADLASCSLQKRITIFRYKWNGNVQGTTINWKNTGPDKRIHPTQKPLALYKWCLKKYAKPGWKILDTHGGSMASVVAALDMGFSITCFENDPDYFKKAKKRIEIFIQQSNMFNTVPEIKFYDHLFNPTI